jgi:hypothetical protein
MISLSDSLPLDSSVKKMPRFQEINLPVNTTHFKATNKPIFTAKRDIFSESDSLGSIEEE